MRTGRSRTSKWQVDHTVANAWWVRLIEQQISEKLIGFVGGDEERALLAPDGFESKLEALAFINILGNCSLLDKSFNVSKYDRSMRSFLEDVHEFKKRQMDIGTWEQALSMSATITAPDGSSLKDIREALETRDATLRKDLVDFISGSHSRVD